MIIKLNVPGTWDDVWNTPGAQDFKNSFQEALRGIRSKRIRQRLAGAFGCLENLRPIEPGGGSGAYSALMAMEGGFTQLSTIRRTL